MASFNMRERDLFKIIIDFTYERGWLTDNEKYQIDDKWAFNDKKEVLFNILKNMTSEDNASRLLCAIRCINEFDRPHWEYDEDKNTFLSYIMSILVEKALFTKEERIEFERQHFGRFDSENSTEIIWDSLNVDKTEVEAPVLRTIVNDTKNPLQLAPVIRCILQYLNFEEIKNCRYISKEWASIALHVLTVRSMICFYNAEGEKSKTPVKFFQVFPDTLEDIIPFSAFSFIGDSEECSPWLIEELNYFFQRQGKYIFELKLRELCLEDETWDDVEKFNITQWLSNSPISQSSNKRKTKLSVRVDMTETTDLSVDLNTIAFVEDLKLIECHLNIQDKIRISPFKLHLHAVTIFKDGNALPDFCINDIVDFSRTESITLLCHGEHEEEATSIYLDLGRRGTLTINYIELRNVTVQNWKFCRWTVNELILDNVKLTESIEMQIKKLTFSDSDIEFSFLPHSLKRLRLRPFGRNNCFCSYPVVLPNLKSLHLSCQDVNLTTFYQNLRCPNLVILRLEKAEVDMQWIPENIKILYLHEVTLKNEPSTNLNLDKLVLIFCHPTVFETFLRTPIHTKEMVLQLSWQCQDNNVVSTFLEFLKNHNKPNRCQTVFAGEFDWDMFPPDSRFRSFVDSEAYYYVFENGKGKAIHGSVISEMLYRYDSDPENE